MNNVPPTASTMPGQNIPMFKLMLIHAFVGMAIFIALFLTVLNYDVKSSNFEKQWVETGVFQDRWNDLIDHWLEDGYFKNAGLWHLNSDRSFKAWANEENANYSGWKSETTFDRESEYYYRSNPSLSLLPLLALQKVKIVILGGDSSRRVSVLYGQTLTMMAGWVLGIIGTVLSRRTGLAFMHALALGICAQVVFQTHPLNLASSFRIFFQHPLNVFLCMFILSLVLDDQRAVWRWFRATSMALCTLAEPIAGVVLVASYVVLNVIVDRDKLNATASHDYASTFRRHHAVTTVLVPCIAALALVVFQFAFASLTIPNLTLVGNSLAFRTGLDGDTKWHENLYEAFNGMLFNNYLYGPGTSNIGGSPAFWIPGLISVLATVMAAAWSRRDGEDQKAVREIAYYTALMALMFVLMAVIFNNAMVIHPFIYPLMILPAICLAMFTFVPALVAGSARYRWPIVGVAVLLAISVAMSNLRYFAVTFPL